MLANPRATEGAAGVGADAMRTPLFDWPCIILELRNQGHSMDAIADIAGVTVRQVQNIQAGNCQPNVDAGIRMLVAVSGRVRRSAKSGHACA